ncbi:nitrate ABC transporter permease [soil metagenome]
MSMPALAEPADPIPAAEPPTTIAKVVALTVPKRALSGRAGRVLAELARTVLPPLVMILALLALWQVGLGGRTDGLPAPLTIWKESRDLILHPFFDHGGLDKGLFWHVLTSLKRVGIGFSLAGVVGIGLGVLIGANAWAYRGLDPIFQVLRTVPPLAWLPISLAAFHQANPSALFVIFITAIWPVVINTAVGVRNIPADYVNVGRVLRLSPLEYFIRILLPAATPYIFTGLRIGVGMSWLAIVASEMLLGGVGIGFFIWDQYNASRISDIIVALAWVGMTGFVLDRAVALLGHVVSRGTAKS